MRLFARLAEEARGDPDRIVRPGQITPILEESYPGWYLDRDGLVLGANLPALQLWSVARPAELYGCPAANVYARSLAVDSHGIPDPATWTQSLGVMTRLSRWETRVLEIQARLRLVEGDWGAVVEFLPHDADRETVELFRTWEKRAIRLWGSRSYVQYDLTRFREYAFSLKEVGLTRHRNRRDELAPHAALGLVRDALDEPDVLWKTPVQVAERTGLPLALVSSAIRALHELGGEVVRAPMVSGVSRRSFTTREHLAHAGPRWQRLASRLGEWRP